MLGQQLKRVREAAGLTQEQLAFKAGLHRTYISQLERDQKSPTINALFRICQAVGVKPSVFIAAIEEHEPRGKSRKL